MFLKNSKKKNHTNIIVISHRRSGTHLTLDAIRNNFNLVNKKDGYFNLDRIKNSHGQHVSLDKAKNEIENNYSLIKSHCHRDLLSFFDCDEEKADYVKSLLKKSKIIYVYRDGKDVLVSLFNYMKKFDKSIVDMPFSKFIRMNNGFDDKTDIDRIEFLKYHVNSWAKQKEFEILPISFESFLENYHDTMQKIALFLNLEFKNEAIVNVLRKKTSLTWLQKITNYFTKKYTSINFNKGVKGGFNDYFSQDDLNFYHTKMKDLEVF